jgi:Replication initiator protein A
MGGTRFGMEHERPTSDTDSLLDVAPDVVADPAEELSRLFYELNLLRLEGSLFCFDPKDVPRRSGSRFEFFDATKRPVTITPNPLHGYPSVTAYKVLQAVMKKLSDYGVPRPSVVSFSQRELSALIGRKGFGRTTSEQLVRALMQLQGTQVTCALFQKDGMQEDDRASARTRARAQGQGGRWVTATFSVLPKVLLSGRNARIEQCAVYLEPWIIESLNAKHFSCLNYDRLKLLEPIGMALYKRVYFTFSRHYNGKNPDAIRYVKDYGAICREWLGGLRELRYKSQIERDQLGAHLRQLRRVGLIRQYEIERNVKEDGYNIVFHPGVGFFRDYDAFYLKEHQFQLPFAAARDKHDIQQPLELVEYFYRELLRVPSLDAQLLSAKETNLAAELIERYGYEDARDLVRFALEAAPNTKFEMKSFGAVRTYLPQWLASRDARAKARAQQEERAAREREERLRDAYEHARRQEAHRLIADTPPEELSAIEQDATARWKREHGDLPTMPAIERTMVRVKTEQLVLDRSGFPPFETWRVHRQQG